MAELLVAGIPDAQAGDDRGRRPLAEPRAPGRAQPAAARLSSLTTASERAGHAVFAQSSNSRSVRHARASERSGSTHRNVPAPPKWPNVAGEASVPVQWSGLRVLELEAQAPVEGVEAADAGENALQAGELHGRRLGERLGRDERRPQQLAGEEHEVGERAVNIRAGGAAELRPHSERPEDGGGEVLRKRDLRSRRRRARRAPRSPGWSRCGALPDARSAGRRRTEARSRGRADGARSSRAAPPARRGRPRPPRRPRASRAPSRASSPRPSGRRDPRARAARSTPSGRTTAARGVLGAPFVDLAKRVHGGRY